MIVTVELSDSEAAALRDQARAEMTAALAQERRAVMRELRLLTLQEVCEALDLSEKVVKGLLAKHRVPTVDLGHHSKRYDYGDVKKLIAQRKILPVRRKTNGFDGSVGSVGSVGSQK